MTPDATGRARTATDETAWTPMRRRSRELLALYGQLVAQRATPERIRWEMSVSPRQIERYKAAWRHQQQNGAEAR